jgi:hypothetical protein
MHIGIWAAKVRMIDVSQGPLTRGHAHKRSFTPEVFSSQKYLKNDREIIPNSTMMKCDDLWLTYDP